MINNWYFWMVLTGFIMLIGAIIESFTQWPYMTYIGVFSFSTIICSWTAIALIKYFKK